MKLYTIIKVGYSSGVYGCTGEYFNAIYTVGDRLLNIRFGGLYGAEERISKVFKDNGYTENYCGSEYGKLTRNETRFFKSEDEAIKELIEELTK